MFKFLLSVSLEKGFYVNIWKSFVEKSIYSVGRNKEYIEIYIICKYRYIYLYIDNSKSCFKNIAFCARVLRNKMKYCRDNISFPGLMAYLVSGTTEVTKFCDCWHSTPATYCESTHWLFFLTLPREANLNHQHTLMPVCALAIRRNKTAAGSLKKNTESFHFCDVVDGLPLTSW